MAGGSRERDRERLARQIEGYSALLARLKETAGVFRRFSAWSEVVAFMREGTSEDPLKEDVLLAIFRALAEGGDPRWQAILLVIFWPGLESVFNQKRGWDKDEEERWQNVTWAFVQAVSKLDVARRTDRIVQRVINSTIHRLHDEYRRVWDRAGRETATDPERIGTLPRASEEPAFEEIELRSDREAEVERFRRHMEAGRISEDDFRLLVETRVGGKSAAQFARDNGMSPALARQRRLRAETAIRRGEAAF
jgi:hypothetical protein